MTPTPEQIIKSRRDAGLTQSQAAELVHVTLNGWQKWEYGEREMPGAAWELFCLKVKALHD